MSPIRNWYPNRLQIHQQQGYCEWVHLENIPFTDAFFDETLAKARGTPINSSPFRPHSSVTLLAPWSASLAYVHPTAFIFHVSRCGSTLLSQLLGLDPQCISLAEVPFFDDILRLPYKSPGTTAVNIEEALTAAIRFYGQKRSGQETHLFIKLDSWHIFFWKQFRDLYPDVPFILLYRQPDEVVHSNRKLRGMQAVPGLIEAELFGFNPPDLKHMPLDTYMAQVLERYFSAYLDVFSQDQHILLLNYQDGPQTLLEQAAAFSGFPIDNAYLAKAAVRASFHSKHPQLAFSEKKETLEIPPYLEEAFALYQQLEHLRLQPK